MISRLHLGRLGIFVALALMSASPAWVAFCHKLGHLKEHNVQMTAGCLLTAFLSKCDRLCKKGKSKGMWMPAVEIKARVSHQALCMDEARASFPPQSSQPCTYHRNFMMARQTQGWIAQIHVPGASSSNPWQHGQCQAGTLLYVASVLAWLKHEAEL